MISIYIRNKATIKLSLCLGNSTTQLVLFAIANLKKFCLFWYIREMLILILKTFSFKFISYKISKTQFYFEICLIKMQVYLSLTM